MGECSRAGADGVGSLDRRDRVTARPPTRSRPPLHRAHVRVPDERARLRAHRRTARGRRARRRRRPRADADVVVLNTCCIRENADNKLYGNLGHLKTWKGETRRPPDRRVRLPGPEGPRRGPRRAGHVDVVHGHPQRAPRRRAASGTPATTGRSPRSSTRPSSTTTRMFPSALPAVRETSFNAWVTIQIGCDNSCAFCIVPAVRGVEISPAVRRRSSPRSRRSPATGVTEVTLLGQNVNSYGRDLQLAARRDGDDTAALRPLFADLLRAVGAVDGIRRVRFTSPHPKDMRPETFAAMAETPAVCPQLHYPLQSGSDRVLAADAPRLHRRALPRPARRGAPGRARPRRVDRHHRRLPRRDRRRLRRARWRSPPRPASTTPSRSSSRPVRAPRRRR